MDPIKEAMIRDEDRNGPPSVEARANARLFWAAPDMLAALELIQGFNWQLDNSPEGKEIKRRALAAIARATGA